MLTVACLPSSDDAYNIRIMLETQAAGSYDVVMAMIITFTQLMKIIYIVEVELLERNSMKQLRISGTFPCL
jgi:hypothetical protein